MLDCGEIMDGVFDLEGFELVWLKDLVDVFFIYVQGFVWFRLMDSMIMWVGYVGKIGYFYIGIGCFLVKCGEGILEDFMMDCLKIWLCVDLECCDVVLWENWFYIFFCEVIDVIFDDGLIGVVGLFFIVGCSFVVDNCFLFYGFFVFVMVNFLDLDVLDQLFVCFLIVDDIGFVICGLVCGDLFIGFGDVVGWVVGNIWYWVIFMVLIFVVGFVN